MQLLGGACIEWAVMPRLTDLEEICIYVDDLQCAKAFYEQVLGLRLLGRSASARLTLRADMFYCSLFAAPQPKVRSSFLPTMVQAPYTLVLL